MFSNGNNFSNNKKIEPQIEPMFALTLHTDDGRIA